MALANFSSLTTKFGEKSNYQESLFGSCSAVLTHRQGMLQSLVPLKSTKTHFFEIKWSFKKNSSANFNNLSSNSIILYK